MQKALNNYDYSLQDILEKSNTGRIISSILSDPRKFWIVFLLFYLTMVQIAELPRSLKSEPHGDIKLYERVMRNISDGSIPYKDFQLEYPPYALSFFVIPSMFKTTEGFRIAFGIQVLLTDILIKILLFWLALKFYRQIKTGNSKEGENNELLPISVFFPVLVFSLVTAPNHYFYLQRYDLFPAFVCLLMMVALYKGNFFLAGLFLMLGAGIKLYPVLFFIPLLVYAAFSKNTTKFLSGVVIGGIPLLLFSLFMPWWKFLEFHSTRGLQCESLWAGIIWLLHKIGLFGAKWTFTRAWVEVTGSASSNVLTVAKIVWILGTVLAIFLATIFIRNAHRSNHPLEFTQLVQILLAVLTVFVAFNIILSPQYLIWISIFAALAAIGRWTLYITLFVIAGILTPFIYPGLNYGTGLGLLETIILLIRNLCLIAPVVLIFKQLPLKYISLKPVHENKPV